MKSATSRAAFPPCSNASRNTTITSSRFTILPGVVDTDTYTAPVNFPGVLTDVKFEGLIPAGTPIAQVVPFQRESWTMELGEQEALIEQNKVTSKLRTRFFDSYKTQYRQVKEYK